MNVDQQHAVVDEIEEQIRRSLVAPLPAEFHSDTTGARASPFSERWSSSGEPHDDTNIGIGSHDEARTDFGGRR